MSSSTATSQAIGSKAKLRDNVMVAVVVDRESKDNSFPCYWLMPAGGGGTFSQRLAQVENLSEILSAVLADPLLETLLFSEATDLDGWAVGWRKSGFKSLAIKQFLPGVTDNLAHVVEEALAVQDIPFPIKVASGRIILSKESLEVFQDAPYKLYHPLVEHLTEIDLNNITWSDDFPGFPVVQLAKPAAAPPISLDIPDSELIELSRRRVLALSLSEMQTIKAYFADSKVKRDRLKNKLPGDPTEVELEVIAQTWSEHCKHKIFNAIINFTDYSDERQVKKREIKGLYKTFIQGATTTLQPLRKDLLSVFKDNAGVVRWNDHYAVCFKVETHNSPSALEPYGGALTGILGVNRDILGTGLGAKPIFNTDVLCFAHPAEPYISRPKLLPPKAIVDGVRKGIQDGGNKSGIPTVNGGIYFHPGFRAKPLVFCGTGGILPLKISGERDFDGYSKHTRIGDVIVMAGGRVGKDGVHGATFSSEELHENSPISAVQIGDPFTQKRLIDFVLEARDLGLITGITDNGAGGLSSSVGEMAQITGGATIELDSIPIKYAGLADWEIVVSESQERMTISTDNFSALRTVAEKHHVEVSEIGKFSESGRFDITRSGNLVASLDLEFLHNGNPALVLEAEWKKENLPANIGKEPNDLGKILLRLLARPNICNRESVIRQYDHEVQAASIIKPLMGARQKAACDAAVLLPIPDEDAALAVSNGLCPQQSQLDPYIMAICAVDEAVRSLVCVGADPKTISLLDNFCWPDPVVSEKNKNGRAILGQLVRACGGLFSAAVAFEAPLISGKDSMKNDFDDGTVRLSIPPTLLISAIARVPQANQAISMEFKHAGDIVYLLQAGTPSLANSEYAQLMDWQDDHLCSLDLNCARATYRALHQAIQTGYVRSAHDVSDGGFAVALAECVIGSGKGTHIVLKDWLKKYKEAPPRLDSLLFAEGPGTLLVTVDAGYKQDFESLFEPKILTRLGVVTEAPSLEIRLNTENESPLIALSVVDLETAWNEPLPFS
jgi:phosphoribosylformylglycinamidine synthase